MKIRKHLPMPIELRHPSALGSISVIGHALGLFVLPAALVRLLFALPLPHPLQIGLALPLILLAGQGLHMLGFLGHEGLHFSLHPNRKVSAALGVFFSSLVPGHLDMGFAISHWNHHRFTNEPNDPDCAVFKRHRTLLGRLLFARVDAELLYAANTARLALGRPLPFEYKFPLGEATVRTLARWNLVSSLLILVLYGTLTAIDPLTGLVSIGMPFLFVTLISGLRPYIEHADTSVGETKDTRTRKSLLHTALYLGTNYHIEHHLYPNIPCYRLPEVHRILDQQGLLVGAPVETSFLGSLRHATASSQYPEGSSSQEPGS